MSKLSLIEREKKRERLFFKFLDKRNKLKLIIKDSKKTESERYLARIKLQDLPRNSNKIRRRNRCMLTGRSRGVFRKFGLSRGKLREIAFRGEIPGLIKSSW